MQVDTCRLDSGRWWRGRSIKGEDGGEEEVSTVDNNSLGAGGGAGISRTIESCAELSICQLRLVVPHVFLCYVISFQAGFLLGTYPVWFVAPTPPPQTCPVLLLPQLCPLLTSGFNETRSQ